MVRFYVSTSCTSTNQVQEATAAAAATQTDRQTASQTNKRDPSDGVLLAVWLCSILLHWNGLLGGQGNVHPFFSCETALAGK